MEDKPRYSRITDLIDLIVFMSSKLNGVSLYDIQKRFNVSTGDTESTYTDFSVEVFFMPSSNVAHPDNTIMDMIRLL